MKAPVFFRGFFIAAGIIITEQKSLSSIIIAGK